MTRLGIFGGTFAPFHRGHRKALEAFLKQARIDRCLVIPSGIPPHKQKTALFTNAQRLEMTRLACKDLPHTEVCDWELRRREKSYTCNTLKWICETYPDCRPVLYVGSDMFLTLQDWYCPQEIFDRAEIAAFSRTGEDLTELKAHGEWLKQNFNHVDYTVYTEPPFPVSSTEIREKWEKGEDFSHLVPAEVYRYLVDLRPTQLYEQLEARLSPKRLTHVLGVMEEAEELALLHGADTEKARIAGLLHDITKEFTREEHFRLFEQYNYPLDENLKTNKNLWHAHSASLDLTETFGITDPEIISAVRYHTTGKADMTPLEAILFTADAIEPNRGYDDLEFYRQLAREDLYKAAYLITVWTMEDLKRRNLPCHRDMTESYEFLKQRFPHVTIDGEKQRMKHPTKGL